MEFFNKKEEVINLQLTQYGRHLMSKGKFKPVYYSFYDNNILYNVERARITEEQNEAEKRIRETPTMHPQIGFSSLEKEFQNNYDLIVSNKITATDTSLQRTAEKHYLLPQPIGTSDTNSEYSPSWSFRFLNGRISGSVNHLHLKEKSGGKNTLTIPQISSHKKIEYIDVTSGDFEYNETLDGPLKTNFAISTDEDDQYFLLKVMEINGLYQKKNFDIEFYEVYEEETDSGNIVETLKPLNFSINYDPENELTFIGQHTPADDQDYVEYYFDFRVDDEIGDQILCKFDPVSEKLGVHADNRTILCQDVIGERKKTRAVGNIYIPGSGVDPGADAIRDAGKLGDSDDPGEVC